MVLLEPNLLVFPVASGILSFLGLWPCPPSSKPTRVHLFLTSAGKIFFFKDSCDEIGSSWVIQDSLTSQGPSQGPRPYAHVKSPFAPHGDIFTGSRD